MKIVGVKNVFWLNFIVSIIAGIIANYLLQKSVEKKQQIQNQTNVTNDTNSTES